MGYVDGSRQRGGKAYRQSQSLKAFIKKRDNYTCQICGAPGRDVSHKIAWHISHDSSIGNLYLLCHRCNLLDRRTRIGHSIPADQYESYLRAELAKYVPVY